MPLRFLELLARDAPESGGLPGDAASGASPGPAPAVRSSPLAIMGRATESMQPTSGADSESQGASSLDGRAVPLPRTIARDALESGGLPGDAASGASPGPAPAVRSSPMAVGGATESMQPTSGADSESQRASSIDGRAAPLPRTIARDALENGGLSGDAASGASPGPAPAVRLSPMGQGTATDSMQPRSGADPESQGASSLDGRADPALALRSSTMAMGKATESMQPTSGADPAPQDASSIDKRADPLTRTMAQEAPLAAPSPVASGATPSLAAEVPVESDPSAAGLRQIAVATKDPDGPGPASAPEVGSISAQIQRLMQAGADPVRTDGLGLVAPPGADGTSQLNAVGTTPPPTIQMGSPAGAPGWGDELGQRVLWLVGQRGSVAELRLDPPELGSLEIRIRQKKDATSVSFVVQSSSAREAVELALPRLREIFAEAGLSLQSMDVSERQSGERRGDEGERGTGGDAGLAEGRFAGGELSPRTAGRGGGLIDTYA